MPEPDSDRSPPRRSNDATAALLGELHSEGVLVETDASFSIDANQALAKLRDYQLADPHAYVGLLVEAAVLAGVDEVQVEISAGELVVDLGALAIEREVLDQLFAAVFTGVDDLQPSERRRRRAIKKLALAVNAALRVDPTAIEIACRDPSGAGWLLTLSPDQILGEVCEHGPVPASFVRVRSRLLTELVDESREARFLREHCAFASVPIHLDHKRISQSLERALHTELTPGELTLDVRARKMRDLVLDGVVIGYAAIRYTGGQAPELRVMTNGVLAETLMLDDLGRPAASDFMAIVDLDLAKDLGQSKLMRGPAFDRVLELVWSIHDEIAPSNPAARNTAPGPLIDLGGFNVTAVVLPLPVLLIGVLILTSYLGDNSVDAWILIPFSILLILGSLVAIVRAFRTPG